jgi:hypothetical protein
MNECFVKRSRKRLSQNLGGDWLEPQTSKLPQWKCRLFKEKKIEERFF